MPSREAPVCARVAFNRRISAAYYHLGITAPGFPHAFGPGQFVMVRPAVSLDPFLPRAFSIYRIATPAAGTAPTVEILYKVLGKGTQCLSRMEAGQELDVLGPLGNNFTVGESVGSVVLVAGGIGVPPIAALARHLRNPCPAGRQAPSLPARQAGAGAGAGVIRNCVVFLGGKTSEDILCVKDFEDAGATVHITTEDGSMGTCGIVTDLVAPFLLDARHEVPALFTCGPPGMLAAVARLAERFGVACQTSVEANMACGFGACMGCAIEARADGSGPTYKLVCKDGPVFDARELVW